MAERFGAARWVPACAGTTGGTGQNLRGAVLLRFSTVTAELLAAVDATTGDARDDAAGAALAAATAVGVPFVGVELAGAAAPALPASPHRRGSGQRQWEHSAVCGWLGPVDVGDSHGPPFVIQAPLWRGLGMLDRDRFVVGDTAWEKVAPLLPGKPTDPGATGKDNRLFLEAVLWRVRTGGAPRDPPGGFGKRKNVFQRFRPRGKGGGFERGFACLSGGPDFEYALVDGTIVAAHHKASGARGGPKAKPSDARAAA